MAVTIVHGRRPDGRGGRALPGDSSPPVLPRPASRRLDPPHGPLLRRPAERGYLVLSKVILLHLFDERIHADAPPSHEAWSSVCVIVASGGYPGKVVNGQPMTGPRPRCAIQRRSSSCCTAAKDGAVATAGGRVLADQSPLPAPQPPPRRGETPSPGPTPCLSVSLQRMYSAAGPWPAAPMACEASPARTQHTLWRISTIRRGELAMGELQASRHVNAAGSIYKSSVFRFQPDSRSRAHARCCVIRYCVASCDGLWQASHGDMKPH